MLSVLLLAFAVDVPQPVLPPLPAPVTFTASDVYCNCRGGCNCMSTGQATAACVANNCARHPAQAKPAARVVYARRAPAPAAGNCANGSCSTQRRGLFGRRR